jgi:indole-3-glycerol phosphate synthase/phosphoribosylanthranilate isomerase
LFFLSGGLNQKNIKQAEDQNTYGLDINSGVEKEPGKKDKVKIEQLFGELS